MSVDSVFFFRIMTLFACFVTLICMVLAWGKFNNVIRNAIPYPRGEYSPSVNISHGFNASLNLSSLEFYSSYHARGFIRLLHSNLTEPIEVWFNKEHNKSRIDYYNGEVKTYQDGNIGLLLKIVPRYNSVSKTHSIGCWKKIAKGKVQAQSIIPTGWSWPFKATLGAFKYVGDEQIEGKVCTKWQYSHKMLEKNNVYTFWVEKTDPPRPVRYEMNGYDTLLTSYYDKYIVDYSMYEKWGYDKDIFEIPQPSNGSWCWNASQFNHQGDGGEFVMNPMAEFISSPHDDDPMDSEFHRYKKKHGKVYDQKEHSKRKHIFKHNARFIHSVNRRNLNFKLKLNLFADMTDMEYGMHKGALPDSYEERKREKRSNKKLIHEKYKPKKHSPEIPDELDWRKYGAVSKPRGQGMCGSCWAFAAVGAMEGANFIKTGKLVQLSEQQMMDCTWQIKGLQKNSGNNACHGGWAWKAVFWARSNKIATRESYSPYRAQEGYCKTENLTVGVKIYGFRRVKRWSPIALRKAVAYHGPAAVSMNSHPIALKFYSSGILDDKSCTNGTDHAVLVVGYGKENGTKYWLVKNSWSAYWGDEGYVKIKENFCGILKKPVVVFDKHLKHYPWKKKGHKHRNKRKHKNKHKHRNKHRTKHKHKHKHKHKNKHKRKKHHRKKYKNSKKRKRKH